MHVLLVYIMQFSIKLRILLFGGVLPLSKGCIWRILSSANKTEESRVVIWKSSSEPPREWYAKNFTNNSPFIVFLLIYYISIALLKKPGFDQGRLFFFSSDDSSCTRVGSILLLWSNLIQWTSLLSRGWLPLKLRHLTVLAHGTCLAFRVTSLISLQC